MGKDASPRRVVGLGGIFFKAKTPQKLANWYQEHLGLKVFGNMALFSWANLENPKRKGHTVWSVFPRNSRYFGGGKSQFMVNYRVKNLRALVKLLRSEGIPLARKVEKSQYGLFAWITDPDGNRIELWEPPKNYKASEEEISSE